MDLMFRRRGGQPQPVAPILELFDIVVTTPGGHSHTFDQLCKRLSLCRFRFITWAETFGLVSGTESIYAEAVGAGPRSQNNDVELRAALGRAWKDLHTAILFANIFTERFELRGSDTASQEEELRQAASITLPIHHDRFEAVKSRIREQQQAQFRTTSWTVSRWTVHDLITFAAAVGEIEGMIRTLEAAPTSPGALRDGQFLLDQGTQVISGAASMFLFQNSLVDERRASSLSKLQLVATKRLKAMAQAGALRGPAGNPPSSRQQPRASETSMLCGACSTITLPMLVHGFQHAHDIYQVVESVERCKLCALLLHEYRHQACSPNTAPCTKRHGDRLTFAISPPERGMGGTRTADFRLDGYHRGRLVRIFGREESGLFRSGILTLRDEQPADSPRNIRLLQNWLKDCCTTHDDCSHGLYSGSRFDDLSGSTPLPFRVIDVGAGDGSQTSRLVTTAGRATGRYLTLSHCWGKTPVPKTTRRTVDAWHEQLPEDQLSKTFLDAVWLTRQLGERFLWIDSLCIVQDDPADLATQIGLMGAIFEQSYCTIAAVDAKGHDGALPDRGLFLSGLTPNTTTVHLRLPHKPLLTDPRRLDSTYNTEAIEALRRLEEEGDTPPDQVHDIFLQTVPKRAARQGPFHTILEKKAWSSRGWVYQERELSRRCIFFLEETLAWKCSRYVETERDGIDRRHWRLPLWARKRSTLKNVTFSVEYQLQSTWQHIVSKYSETKLSFISDKANALAGLEERLRWSHCGARFHCGLLDFGPREIFCLQLLWLPKIGRPRSVIPMGDSPFPSWSWMAIDGAVDWLATGDPHLPEALVDIDVGDDGPSHSLLHPLSLTISGPCQAIKLGPLINDIPDASRRAGWHPHNPGGMGGVAEALLDGSSTRIILSAISGKVIGWLLLDSDAPTAEEPLAEMLAIPFLQYLKPEEHDPMCVDFLAIAERGAERTSGGSGSSSSSATLTDATAAAAADAGSEGSGDAGVPDIYTRVGRGRVLKGALDWLQNCHNRSFTLV